MSRIYEKEKRRGCEDGRGEVVDSQQDIFQYLLNMSSTGQNPSAAARSRRTGSRDRITSSFQMDFTARIPAFARCVGTTKNARPHAPCIPQWRGIALNVMKRLQAGVMPGFRSSSRRTRMSKTITIQVSACKECPYFNGFPAEFFDGDCANKDVPKGQDSRITNEDAIPPWCPL